MAQKVKFKTIEGPGAGQEYEREPGKDVKVPRKGEPFKFPSKDNGEIVTKPVREVREKDPGFTWVFKDDDKSTHVLEVEKEKK